MAKDTDRRNKGPEDMDEREKRNAGFLDDRAGGRDYEEPDGDAEGEEDEDTPERIYVRGEGGALLEFDYPLPLGIQHRLDHGYLARVSEDGSPWIPPKDDGDGEGEPEPPYGDRLPGRPADAGDPMTGPQAGDNPVIAGRRADLPGEPPEGYEPDEDDEENKPGDAPALPKKTASKDTWVEFAVSQGMDREEAAGKTRDDLAGEFTKERQAP